MDASFGKAHERAANGTISAARYAEYAVISSRTSRALHSNFLTFPPQSGAENDEGFTLAGDRSTILNEFGGYDRLDYSPKRQTWFVLSGYRENIYYQKVRFCCNGRIINALRITFPAAEKSFREGLIDIMDDGFRAWMHLPVARPDPGTPIGPPATALFR